MEKKKSIFDMIVNILIIIGMIYILVGLSIDFYKKIKITNKISQPENCIIVNNDFYCKVEK